jgi:hypothetical protein
VNQQELERSYLAGDGLILRQLHVELHQSLITTEHNTKRDGETSIGDQTEIEGTWQKGEKLLWLPRDCCFHVAIIKKRRSFT